MFEGSKRILKKIIKQLGIRKFNIQTKENCNIQLTIQNAVLGMRETKVIADIWGVVVVEKSSPPSSEQEEEHASTLLLLLQSAAQSVHNAAELQLPV